MIHLVFLRLHPLKMKLFVSRAIVSFFLFSSFPKTPKVNPGFPTQKITSECVEIHIWFFEVEPEVLVFELVQFLRQNLSLSPTPTPKKKFLLHDLQSSEVL